MLNENKYENEKIYNLIANNIKGKRKLKPIINHLNSIGKIN
jgi:hypothetical protein